MDEVIQLFSFFVSFCIGFVFSIVTKFHFKLVDSYPKILQYLLTVLYVIDFVLLYVILMYHINGGVIHIYFLAFVFVGFFCSEVLQSRFKFKIDALLNFFIKHKKN